MKDFGYILTIMIEIAFTIFAISYLINAEKRLKNSKEEILNRAIVFFKGLMIAKFKLKEINKTVAFIKKLRLLKIKKIINTTSDLINLFFMVKAFSFKKKQTYSILRRISSITKNIKQTI